MTHEDRIEEFFRAHPGKIYNTEELEAATGILRGSLSTPFRHLMERYPGQAIKPNGRGSYLWRDLGSPARLSPGEAACRAWSDSHESHHPGCKLVSWEDLKPADREDWERAAIAAAVMS